MARKKRRQPDPARIGPGPGPGGSRREALWHAGHVLDFGAARTLLELSTPLETALFMGAAISLFMGLGAAFDAAGSRGVVIGLRVLAVGWGAALAFGLVRWAISFRYELDNTGRTVEFVRDLLGLRMASRACAFSDVLAVAVDGEPHSTKRSSWWEFRVILVRRDGSSFAVSDESRDLRGMNRVARNLATHLGCPVVEGREEGHVRVTWDPDAQSYRVGIGPRTWGRALGSLAWFLVTLAFAVVVTGSLHAAFRAVASA